MSTRNMVPISKAHQTVLNHLIGMYGQVEVAKLIKVAIATMTKAASGREVRQSSAAWIQIQLDKLGHNRTTCKEAAK